MCGSPFPAPPRRRYPVPMGLAHDDDAGIVFLADVGSWDGHAMVRLIGELDLVTADAAESTAERALEHGWRGSLIVDLSEVSFCDSTGMRALSHISEAARRRGREMVLRGTQPPVRRVLEIAGFDTFFEFVGGPRVA
jgi:stage II sporulation protein AA (anti-sigma F factor antagonist)